MARKSRLVRAYAAIGHRIAALEKRQEELVRAVGLAQQAVSKKLWGETAIFLSDIERRAKHYKVSMTHFFEGGVGSPDLAAAWERIRNEPGPHQELVLLASTLPVARVKQLLKAARLTSGSAKSESATGQR